MQRQKGKRKTNKQVVPKNICMNWAKKGHNYKRNVDELYYLNSETFAHRKTVRKMKVQS